MSFPRPARSAIRSDINMTPLVDVCLVLLIIFMVVTPMVGQGGRVTLPETNRPAPLGEQKDELTVTLDADGQLFVGEVWVPAERFSGALDSLHARSPDRRVRLRADRSLRYEKVRQVLQTLRAAGFENAGIVTVRRGSEPV